MNYVNRAIESVKDCSIYAGKSAKRFGQYVWKEKLPIGIGLGATAGAWALVSGHPDNYVLRLIPQTVAAASSAYLAKRRGHSPMHLLLAGIVGAAAYEVVEHLNMIPPVNDVLTSISPGLGNEFPGQDPRDIGIAGSAGALLADLPEFLKWKEE